MMGESSVGMVLEENCGKEGNIGRGEEKGKALERREIKRLKDIVWGDGCANGGIEKS